MSSTAITDIYQHNFEAIVANRDLAIATPFTALFLGQTPQIDFGANTVTIELFKGNRKTAPLISRLAPGGGVDISQYTIRPGSAGVNDYLYSLISQNFEIPASVCNKRVPTEPPFAGPSGTQAIRLLRRNYWLQEEATDAIRRILVRNERLAIQSFFDSEMDIGDTFQSDTKLVFPRNSNLKGRTVTTSWATSASATPWDDYGDAQKAIKQYSQVDGANLWYSFLSSDAIENLKAIYRSQREGLEQAPILQYNDFNFNPDTAVPTMFQFLVSNGCEYQGWIRSSYSQSKIHLFTLPEGYDASLTDSTETYTDFISGDTVSLGLYNPNYFKAYFGPGIKDPPEAAFYTANFPSVPALPASGPLTIGQSRIPASTMLLNLYPLGQNSGIGGVIEHAPIFAPIRPDVVATIATTTTA